ncbi:MAG TPA: type II toxin-antitoxin system VapB family antitoxin [Solirubrobacterales bacterium]|nr:type II toxin-antitoxin system VapB family antitoxin [Solirubrobacterales bacterium]
MALTIKDAETKKLVIEVAKLAGESKEEAVRQALLERRARLRPESDGKRRRPRTKAEMLHYLETEIWPLIPAENRGGPAITKEEKEEILGYGPEGF